MRQQRSSAHVLGASFRCSVFVSSLSPRSKLDCNHELLLQRRDPLHMRCIFEIQLPVFPARTVLILGEYSGWTNIFAFGAHSSSAVLGHVCSRPKPSTVYQATLQYRVLCKVFVLPHGMLQSRTIHTTKFSILLRFQRSPVERKYLQRQPPDENVHV